MDGFFFFLQDPAAPAPGAPAAAGTAQDPAAPPPQGPMGGGGLGGMMVPLVLMFVVFYFLMLRPQRKQAKERELMIANLKKNDHVVTSFGIHGIVKQARPEDKDILLCIDEAKDVRIRVTKAAIAAIEKVAGGEAETKPEAQEKAKS